MEESPPLSTTTASSSSMRRQERTPARPVRAAFTHLCRVLAEAAWTVRPGAAGGGVEAHQARYYPVRNRTTTRVLRGPDGVRLGDDFRGSGAR